MSPEQIRALVAQLAIASAVCGGLYAMAAEPLRGKAREAEAELEQVVSAHEAASQATASLPEIVGRAAQTRAQIVEVDAKSLLAADESEMFALTMDLSQEAGIVIEQITPSGQSAAPEETSTPTRPGDLRVRYAISGNGTYGSVGRFVGMLGGEWAYCSLRNCRITPDFTGGEEDSVQFTLVIELFAFDTSPMGATAAVPEVTP